MGNKEMANNLNPLKSMATIIGRSNPLGIAKKSDFKLFNSGLCE